MSQRSLDSEKGASRDAASVYGGLSRAKPRRGLSAAAHHAPDIPGLAQWRSKRTSVAAHLGLEGLFACISDHGALEECAQPHARGRDHCGASGRGGGASCWTSRACATALRIRAAAHSPTQPYAWGMVIAAAARVAMGAAEVREECTWQRSQLSAQHDSSVCSQGRTLCPVSADQAGAQGAASFPVGLGARDRGQRSGTEAVPREAFQGCGESAHLQCAAPPRRHHMRTTRAHSCMPRRVGLGNPSAQERPAPTARARQRDAGTHPRLNAAGGHCRCAMRPSPQSAAPPRMTKCCAHQQRGCAKPGANPQIVTAAKKTRPSGRSSAAFLSTQVRA